MTTLDIELLLDRWLGEGTDALPDHSIEAVLRTLEHTPQRGASRASWRTWTMNDRPHLGLLAGAAIIVVLVVGGLSYLGGTRVPSVGGGVSPSPSRSPIPSASTAPSASPTSAAGPIDTASWTTFSSDQYGFNVGHPRDWIVDPADREWNLDTDAADWLSPAMDDFIAPSGDLRVSVWSAEYDPSDMANDSRPLLETWIEQYCEKTGNASCSGILQGAVPMCVEVRDCHPSTLVGVAPPFDREVQAFLTGGIYHGRMVVVTVWRSADDPSVTPYGGGRRLIEAFLSTMCVVPQDPRPEPAPCGDQLGDSSAN